MEAKFTIQGRLPGYNELTHGHWASCQRIKNVAMETVGWAAEAAKIKPVRGRVKVTIRCYEPNRRRDDDNVTSGASKVILDALQNCGILSGDGQKYVRCIKRPVEVDKANPRVEVEISEVHDG